MRVLAVMAHPDDIEMTCAGTLVLLKRAGWDVHLATMTAGDLGSATRSRASIARIRKKEAAASAKLLGASYTCLGFDDLTIVYGEATKRRVSALLRLVRPDLVIAPSPVDYMADHEETPRIVREAAFASTVPNWKASLHGRRPRPAEALPAILYSDPIDNVDHFGRRVPAQYVVDITASVDLKEKMLACHESQRAWLRAQHGEDEYLLWMRRVGADRARDFRSRRVRYAEGFRQHLGHGFPRQDHLTAALGARVRAIRRADLARHRNADFRIEVIDDRTQFYSRFAIDIVQRIQQAAEAGRKCVLILPVGPVPQYAIAAEMINRLGLSCRHLVTFNMDEYANENGQTAPADWEGSFATSMRQSFFARIRADLRPPEENIHFPTDGNIADYYKMIEDEGGADCCYGGIGWCGHIAFWEAHLGLEFGADLAAYKRAHGRIVELHPMTIMQNALHTFSSDWSWVPPKAASIGPREILGARDRSFWLDGECGGPGMSWQRFIARLVAHGPVNTLVPGSILQESTCGYHILGSVAEDVRIDFS